MIARRFLLTVAAALIFSGAAAAHPYSTARGEIDWNAETARFEVALAVLPEELVQMLGAASGTPFRLEAGPGGDAAIADYLRRHFAASSGGEIARLEWVGKEVAFEATWLYFELVFAKPPASLSGLELRVDLGFELTHEHINAVRIRRGEEQRGLLFSRLQPAARL